MRITRHMIAIGFVLALVGAVPAKAQDLNLSQEELQTFLNANQGLTPEELAKRLKELNDKTLDAQR